MPQADAKDCSIVLQEALGADEPVIEWAVASTFGWPEGHPGVARHTHDHAEQIVGRHKEDV